MNGTACNPFARRQSGTSAIEFALIFPLFFSLAYGGIAYGFTYFLQQRINFAAQEAVRSVVALDPATPNYSTALVSTAQASVLSNFGVAVGGAFPSRVATPTVTTDSGTNTVTVQLIYNLAAPSPLFPTITFPVIGAVPPLPATLQAVAVGRLS